MFSGGRSGAAETAVVGRALHRDGTLIEAWAGQKSFQLRKDADGNLKLLPFRAQFFQLGLPCALAHGCLSFRGLGVRFGLKGICWGRSTLSDGQKMSGRVLGDRGECARCRNGDLSIERSSLRFGSIFYEAFWTVGFCNNRVSETLDRAEICYHFRCV